jgi:acetate kinase
MDTVGFLKEKVGVFKDFAADRLKQLVDGSTVQSFEANEAIAHQGAEATHFGVVLSGDVAASVAADGARQTLGHFHAGDTFGEAALMTGDPLICDFIAEARSEVSLIPVSLFQSIIVSEPSAVRHISRTIAERTKLILSDPAKAAAALQKGNDPYGFILRHHRRAASRPRSN